MTSKISRNRFDHGEPIGPFTTTQTVVGISHAKMAYTYNVPRYQRWDVVCLKRLNAGYDEICIRVLPSHSRKECSFAILVFGRTVVYGWIIDGDRKSSQ